MRSKRRRNKRKDECQGQTAVSSPIESSPTMAEESPPARMPVGFNMDDFLFSKLFKSVMEEGKRTINEILKAMAHQRKGTSSSCTIDQILKEESVTRKSKSILKKYENLEEKIHTGDFDVTNGITLMRHVFYKEYETLSHDCQAQIHSLKELRNSLSHNYPLVIHDFETNKELNYLFEKNEEFLAITCKIRKLEKEKNEPGADRKKIQEIIDEKIKERYVVMEIEKLRVILHDILKNTSSVLEKDFTECKNLVDRNLTIISRVKVQEYNKNTYDSEIERFKEDSMHKLITDGREELKNQYRNLKIANPCPWIMLDQGKSVLNNFSIEKIHTPLRIETSRSEITTENLLILNKKYNSKTPVPPHLVLYGLAGSGKTALCLHLLYHWTEGTDKIKMLKDYSLLIYVELRTVRSNSIVRYLKEQRMKKSTVHIKTEDLVQQLDELKLLFIIDGYDEAKQESREVVKDIFLLFPNQTILITTRTEFKDEIRKVQRSSVKCLFLEICGFDESRIEMFCQKVFDVVSLSECHENKRSQRVVNSSEFLRYIQKQGRILKKHLELPLTLALMIYMWIEHEDILNNVTTRTSLYYELFKLCQEKIKCRLNVSLLNSELEKLLIFLGKKAWKLLLDEEEILSEDDEREIDEECRKSNVPKNELLSAFLMYEPNVNWDENRYNYSYMHRTHMEYLSAYFLAEEADEKHLIDIIGSVSPLFGMHQIIIFLIGHLTRKKMLDHRLGEVFTLLDETEISGDNFNFWLMLLEESQVDGKYNKNLAGEIGREKLGKKKWKLYHNTVVSGLQLLSAIPVQIEELVIDIENGIDPYDIKDLFSTMKSLRAKLQGQYKKKPIIMELFFSHHLLRRCDKPSNDLLMTLYPWGHLRAFAGCIRGYNKEFMLNFCYKMRNFRVRIETTDAQVSLSKSIEKSMGQNMRHLRVILALDPKDCDPDTLSCLTCEAFRGRLELTLPHMDNEDKEWIVQVVKNVSGSHGCFKLFLEDSSLSLCTVFYIMEMLRNVVFEKYIIESCQSLSNEQWIELEKQQKRIHVDVEWEELCSV